MKTMVCSVWNPFGVHDSASALTQGALRDPGLWSGTPSGYESPSPRVGGNKTGFLTGKRLYLREVRPSDVNENYHRWLNDPEVTQYLEVRYVPHSLENIRAYVAALDGKADEIFLAICLREDDRHIGNIKIGPINPIHATADVSLLIGEKDCWGQGYATEAIRLCCAFAFGVRNLRKLNAGVYASNLGSQRAFEKAGFREEGRLRAQAMARGMAEDHVLLGLLASEFGEPGA